MRWLENVELDGVDLALIAAIAVTAVVLVFAAVPGALGWAWRMTDVREWTWPMWLVASSVVLVILVIARSRMQE